MPIKFSDEVRRSEEQRQKSEEKALDLSEKIAALIAAENVTVDTAERALRRAEAIVRTRTMVDFSRP